MQSDETASVSAPSELSVVDAATTDNAAPKRLQTVVGSHVVNVPNALSFLRLILAIGVGVLIDFGQFSAAWVIFIIAASTDFLDGYWARRFNQITKLGRILDPFVDKIIITAAMVSLVGVPGSGVAAWMVTVIVGRELLVTSLRGIVEGSGGDFSARWLGKWKMLFQCVAVVACLWLVGQAEPPQWLRWFATVALWLSVVLTIASGIDYVALVVSLSRRVEKPSA